MVVNFGFLGYPLNPGIHKIELKYEPPFYKAGIGVSLAGILAFVVLIIVYILRDRKGYLARAVVVLQSAGYFHKASG